MKKLFSLIMALIMSLSFTSNLKAEELAGGNPLGGTEYGPQVQLEEVFRFQVKGDYVAAGVGMRNIGSGTINISLPAGSTIAKAFLYWAIIREPGPPAPDTGTFNGQLITGTLVGTSGDPCWPEPDILDGNFIDAYVADVTEIAIDGLNTLTGFPSGLADNTPPQSATTAFPLLEGASLVVIFKNPLFDFNTVIIRDGAQTFSNQSITTSFGNFMAVSGNDVVDQIAQTTYIVADGQARFGGDRASFNSTFVAGPGTSLKPADAFDGTDGIAPVFALDGLWDTLTIDVSTSFIPGVLTSADTDVDSFFECLTYVAQVLSVKTSPMVKIDLKPGSNPNCVNTKANPKSKGRVAVAIFGNGLDISDIDESTIEFGGASPVKCSIEDALMEGPTGQFTQDGVLDLVCHFKRQEVNWPAEGSDCAEIQLEAELLDGTPIGGVDIVCLPGEPTCEAGDPIPLP